MTYTEHEVYADLLFMINFSMDFLCLFLSAKILHRHLRPILIFCAAVVGGIYSVCSLFIKYGKLPLFIFDILVCMIMCILAFARKTRTLRQFICELSVYLATSAALGGMMTALFNLLNRLDIQLNSGGNNISSWLFLLLSLISGIAAIKGSKFLSHLPSRTNIDAEIFFDGKSVTLHGLCDTGNMLREPIGGRPVIITDAKTTLPLLPNTLCEIITSGDISRLSSLPSEISCRVRIIAGTTITGSKLLIGIIPDRALIHGERQTTEVAAIFAPALLTSLPNGFDAIIPAEITK